MAMNLTCSQVGSLLSFYIDDELNEKLKLLVKKHLDVCPSCRAKYEALKKMVSGLKNAKKEIDKIAPLKVNTSSPTLANPFDNEAFKWSLSAYLDNELDDKENMQIKKHTISNSAARKELEKMYSLRHLLKTTFEKEEAEVREDFSKRIMDKLDFQKEVMTNDPMLKKVTTVLVFVMLALVSAVVVLH